MEREYTEETIKDRIWRGEYQARANKHYHHFALFGYETVEIFFSVVTIAVAILGGAKFEKFMGTLTVEFVVWPLGFFSALFIVWKTYDKSKLHYYLFRQCNDLDADWKEVEILHESGEDYNSLAKRMALLELKAIRIEGDQPKAFYWLQRYSEYLVQQEEGILWKIPFLPIFRRVDDSKSHAVDT